MKHIAGNNRERGDSNKYLTVFIGNLIDLQEIKRKTTLGKTTVYQQIKEMNFPAPIHIGRRRVAWVEAEVDAWVRSRIEVRDEKGSK